MTMCLRVGPPFQAQRACGIEPRVRQNPGVGSTECHTSRANRKAVLSLVRPGRNRVAVRRKDGRRSISRPKVASPAARDRQPWAGRRKALGLQIIDRFLTSCSGSGMRKWTLPSGGQSDNLFENRSRRSGRSLLCAPSSAEVIGRLHLHPSVSEPDAAPD